MSYNYPFVNANSDIVTSVWNKASSINGLDSSKWRKDKCGNIIKFEDHGDTDSQYGWEIDHIIPVSLGGIDDLSNLQPLQWQNNRSKSNKLIWNC